MIRKQIYTDNIDLVVKCFLFQISHFFVIFNIKKFKLSKVKKKSQYSKFYFYPFQTSFLFTIKENSNKEKQKIKKIFLAQMTREFSIKVRKLVQK